MSGGLEQKAVTTPGHLFDWLVAVPTSGAAGVAYWTELINSVTGPIVAACLGVLIVVLMFYRVRIARTRDKILQEELRQRERENDVAEKEQKRKDEG